VQIRCNSLRSKSSYGAFGDFHDELLLATSSVGAAASRCKVISEQIHAAPDH
jgi:hypothetical protein